jgi:hypothetical protein
VELQDERATESLDAPVLKQLEYDNKATLITRRQMRYFLLLLTVNTLLFAGFICLPSASPFIKQAWEEYQRKRADAAEKAKQRSLIDACMNYSAPADQVVYAEQPAAADALMARSGQAKLADPRGLFGYGGLFKRLPDFAVQRLFTMGWHPPAVQGSVAPLIALASSNRGSGGSLFQEMRDGNAIFLHQMSTPAGLKRLVWISMEPTGDLIEQRGAEKEGALHAYRFTLGRCFKVTVMDKNADFPVVTRATLQSSATDQARLTLTSESADSKAELKSLLGHWRVCAGQSDAANPSHLTFAYDIDGRPGVIDGWLKDGDRLMLEPRAGHLVRWTSGSEYVWDVAPRAATQSTK